MKSGYLTCLITHGDLAVSLKGAISKLVALPAPLYCFSNQENTLETIEQDIQTLIKENSPEKVVLFVDLIGGSCWLSANRIKRGNQDIAVLGGINLPMLLSFFLNYQRLDWEDFLEKIIDDAKKGILRQ